MSLNEIQTWQQGSYAPESKRPVAPHVVEQHKLDERHLVRPGLRENAVCHCPDPSNARWIAQRLNLASKLERMTYDYATGKTDGSEIVSFVRSNLE